MHEDAKTFNLQGLRRVERGVAGRVPPDAPSPPATTRAAERDARADSTINEAALQQTLELDRLTGGGLFARMVDIYLTQTPTILNDLRGAIEDRDPDRTARAAHSLKSSSLTLGAEGVAALCAELEARGRAGSVEGAASLALQLDEAHPFVTAALEAQVRKHDASITNHQADPVLQPATDMVTDPTGAHALEALLASLKQTGSLIEPPLRPSDRRRAARYVGQLPVGYRWPDGEASFHGMTANISATGLLFALDSADPRIIRDRPAPPDNLLELGITLSTTPRPRLPASISCSARYIRTTVAPGHTVHSAIGVVVDTWKLGKAPY